MLKLELERKSHLIKIDSEKYKKLRRIRRSQKFVWESVECAVLGLKVGLSPSEKACFLRQWKPFKNDRKCFLFYLKSPLRAQDILIFVLTFWSCRKNDLIRKISLISKFMTS